MDLPTYGSGYGKGGGKGGDAYDGSGMMVGRALPRKDADNETIYDFT